MIDLFDFLNLKGFRKWQKKQFQEELDTFIDFKHYVFKYYHIFLTEYQPEINVEVIPGAWRGKSGINISSLDVSTALQSILSTYLIWENRAKDFFYNHEKEAEGIDKDMIHKLYKNTCEEIKEIESLQIELQSTDFNPTHIQIISNKKC